MEPDLALPAATAVTTYHDGGVDVLAVRLDVDWATVGTLHPLLSPVERAHARRFQCWRDQRRFIVRRARLRQLLAARLGIDTDQVSLVSSANGKPGLASSVPGSDGSSAALKFNSSHSGDLALMAFSEAGEVGVDIEAVRPLEEAEAMAVARLYFSESEQKELAGIAPDDAVLGFHQCWTRKEAVVKATGDGLMQRGQDFDVSLAPGDPARILRMGVRPGTSCGWRLGSFTPAPGFVAAVVSADSTGGAA